MVCFYLELVAHFPGLGTDLDKPSWQDMLNENALCLVCLWRKKRLSFIRAMMVLGVQTLEIVISS